MEIAAFYFHCLKVKVVICFYSFYVTTLTRSFNDETAYNKSIRTEEIGSTAFCADNVFILAKSGIVRAFEY